MWLSCCLSEYCPKIEILVHACYVVSVNTALRWDTSSCMSCCLSEYFFIDTEELQSLVHVDQAQKPQGQLTIEGTVDHRDADQVLGIRLGDSSPRLYVVENTGSIIGAQV